MFSLEQCDLIAGIEERVKNYLNGEAISIDNAKIILRLKIHAAKIQLSRLGFDARNETANDRHRYFSAAHVKKAVLECETFYRFNIEPMIMGEIKEHFVPSGRYASYRATVPLKIRIFDMETGYQEEFLWIGGNADRYQKALAKALTSGVKSWAIAFFGIADPTEDPDAETVEITMTETKKIPSTGAQISKIKAGIKAAIKSGNASAVRKQTGFESEVQVEGAHLSKTEAGKVIAILDHINGRLDDESFRRKIAQLEVQT